MEYFVSAMLIGAGATAVMDVWGVVRERLLGTPTSYGLVGRWLAYLARGRFRHERIAATPAVKGEKVIGWTAHYAIGIAFAGLLLAIWGIDWARDPTLGPALIVGIGSVAAPFFLMQPGMGAGFAASRAPRPGRARLQSVVTHAVFGLGLYLAALLNSAAASDGWSGFGFRATGPELPRLVQELELREGAVVADVGAGKGQLTMALAAKVGPNGRVYSTEIDPGRLRQLRGAVAAARLDNVTLVEASASKTGLAPGCCDAIVLRRVYHHLTDPVGINADLLRALRPGGVLAIVDFPPPFFLGRGDFGVPAESVVGEVTASGLELVRRIDDWPGRGPLGAYCVVFRKAS